MRTTIFILALLLLVSMVTNAQVVRVTHDLKTNGHYHSAQGDSVGTTAGKNIYAALTLGGALVSVEPDSIRLDYYVATDTVVGKFYWKAKYAANTGTYSRDSIANVAASGSGTYSVYIPQVKIHGKQVYDVVFMGGSGAGTTATNVISWRVSKIYKMRQ